MPSSSQFVILGACLMILSAGCRKVHSLFETQNLREAYLKKVQDSPLGGNKLLQEWQARGGIPHSNILLRFICRFRRKSFISGMTRARAWRFTAKKGRKMRVRSNHPDSSQRVFLLYKTDAFTPDSNPTTGVYANDRDKLLIKYRRHWIGVNNQHNLQVLNANQPGRLRNF